MLQSLISRSRIARRVVLGCALGLLASCGTLDFDAVSKNGQFEGRLFVMWVGEGSAFSGDGRFVFVPNPEDPLQFTRRDAQGNQIGPVIRPQMMYTDGGSIPSIFTVFKGFSPWGYAPAYMIHDWLFIANHCNSDGTPTPEQAKLAEIDFDTSAVIIAESITALQVSGQVDRNDVALTGISTAVAGPISRGLWSRSGACAGHEVDPDDRKAALRAFPRRKATNRNAVGLSRAQAITPPSAQSDVNATIVGEFGF
ncbi:MAG: hypothetical protein AAF307_14075 [Pseudomonadota bacterium]